MSKSKLIPKDFVDGLIHELSKHEDETKAAPMKKYMKGLYDYYGLKAPERTAVFRQYLKENSIPEDWKKCVELCWKVDKRELQYIGMELAFRCKKFYEKEDWKFFEWMVSNKSWWDTVDFIASNIVGHFFFKFPDMIEKVTNRWNESNDMWLNRTCILFQLKYKDYTDFKLLSRFIHRHKYSDEFFHQKAIGWALRQYAKTDAYAVEAFVTETELKPLSRREALKHIS